MKARLNSYRSTLELAEREGRGILARRSVSSKRLLISSLAGLCGGVGREGGGRKKGIVKGGVRGVEAVWALLRDRRTLETMRE